MRGGGTLDDKADEQAPGTVGNIDIFTRTPSSVITLAVVVVLAGRGRRVKRGRR